MAVLPTGAGKTLIASMWLKRMRELNPEKMGLFVVDRIPLVLQQKKVAISPFKASQSMSRTTAVFTFV